MSYNSLGSPIAAIQHAMNVVKGPFPAGEKLIATNPKYAILYAATILKGPFDLAEDLISQNEETLYKYVINVPNITNFKLIKVILHSKYKHEYVRWYFRKFQ
jgi:hypothetical protein